MSGVPWQVKALEAHGIVYLNINGTILALEEFHDGHRRWLEVNHWSHSLMAGWLGY